MPRLGLVNLLDYESGERLQFDTSGPEARAHAAYMKRAREARHALFRRLRIDSMYLSTHEPYVGRLVEFFRARQRRLRH